MPRIEWTAEDEQAAREADAISRTRRLAPRRTRIGEEPRERGNNDGANRANRQPVLDALLRS